MSSKIELCEKVIKLGLNNDFPCNEIEFCYDCPFDSCCDEFISEKMLDIANEVIRKNKCKYCSGEKSVRGEEYNANVYTIKDKTLNIDIDLAYYDVLGNNIIDYVEAEDFININYCPFCGKKLV